MKSDSRGILVESTYNFQEWHLSTFRWVHHVMHRFLTKAKRHPSRRRNSWSSHLCLIRKQKVWVMKFRKENRKKHTENMTFLSFSQLQFFSMYPGFLPKLQITTSKEKKTSGNARFRRNRRETRGNIAVHSCCCWFFAKWVLGCKIFVKKTCCLLVKKQTLP